MSLSLDSMYLAVGGPGDNEGVGATWVFIRKDKCIDGNPCYTQFGEKLVGNDAEGKANQGTVVVDFWR